MKTVSVSEIIDWRKCPAAWELHYERGLEVAKTPVPLISGTVIHGTIEALLSGMCEFRDASSWAEQQLLTLFESADDPENLTKKYLPGVMKAVNKTPDWVWKNRNNWHVEELMVYTTTDDSGGDVQVRMKPDLWGFLQDGNLHLVEFKTQGLDTKVAPDKALSSYLLFNPQHHWYGVALQDMHPDALIMYSYVVLPTQDKPVAIFEKLFTRKDYAFAKAELDTAASSVGEGERYLNRSSLNCNFCDFRPIHEAVLTGADMESMLADKEGYIERTKSH
jgi:hypothetical protein